MPRGQAADDGATFVNQNGYHHTKANGRFVATHILLMEEKLGRKLVKGEFVHLIDTSREKRANPTIDNLELRTRGDRKSPQARLAQLEAQIEELQAEADELRKKIASNGG